MEEFLLKIKGWVLDIINYFCGGEGNEKNANKVSVSGSTRDPILEERINISNSVMLNEDSSLFKKDENFDRVSKIIQNLTNVKNEAAEESVKIENDNTDKSNKGYVERSQFKKGEYLFRDQINERNIAENMEPRRGASRVSLELEENPFEEARKKLYIKLEQQGLPLFPSPNDAERTKYYHESVRKNSEDMDKISNEELAKEREAKANGRLSFHTRIMSKKEFERS